MNIDFIDNRFFFKKKKFVANPSISRGDLKKILGEKNRLIFGFFKLHVVLLDLRNKGFTELLTKKKDRMKKLSEKFKKRYKMINVESDFSVFFFSSVYN